MIGILLELLQEVRQETEAIEIAKGKYELPEAKDLPKKFKQIWQKRK